MIARLAIRTSRPLCIRFTSSATPNTPMLHKIRNDLKTAMRSKDAARLSVLRSILTSTLNASKTSSPITSDLQLLSLMRKKINTSKAAATEFRENGREDLAGKEEEQVVVLEEYAGGVEVVSEEEIRRVVVEAVERMRGGGEKMGMGDVVKRALGSFGERAVERGEVARVVKVVLEEK